MPLRDLSFAVRTLRRNPVFTLAAAVIGPNRRKPRIVFHPRPKEGAL
jgi:hypothetical protein